MSKKNKVLTLLLISAVVSMGMVQAKVYQCNENGKMLFKDKPCEKKEKIVESGSDMAIIIAEKIKYDKRCTQKLIELVNKNSGKTLTNTNKSWSGKKSIKHIDNKVVCSESSGLTQEALSQAVDGETIASWAKMMQWATKDRHTLRAEWGHDKVISKVTMYRNSMAMPSKPKPRPKSTFVARVDTQPKTSSKSIEAEITAFSENEYPNDYKMQQYIYKKQMSAYRFMLVAKDLEVKKIAKGAYLKDYSMQKYTYDRQLSAKRYMKQVDNAMAKSKATNKYPSDYAMQKYIYDKLAF